MFNIFNNIFVGEFWAIIPALIAIAVALLTKQVYIALFSGVFTGAMLLSYGNPIEAISQVFAIMSSRIGGENGGILIFILMLSILIVLVIRAGASKAFGNFLISKIKTRKGVLIATTVLGTSLFMDDYFNRLAVGKIMSPVADRFRISKAKQAFVVCALSVSVCILVPISSWAGAVTSYIGDGVKDLEAAGTTIDVSTLTLFLKTIPANFYPIITLVGLYIFSILGIDIFGLRKREEFAIRTGDINYGLGKRKTHGDLQINQKGKAIDLVLPIVVLVLACLGAMIYLGCNATYYSSDEVLTFGSVATPGSILEIFNNCSMEGMVPFALATGSLIAVIFTLILYIPRKLISLKEFGESVTDGFKSVADVVIILILAWTLSALCSTEYLNVGAFVISLASKLGGAVTLLPAIMFLIAMVTSFAIGTSWGTFGILVPIAIPMFSGNLDLLVLGISAILSGALFGDQVSPISDAVILSTSCTECDTMDFIKAQMPMGLIVAGISFLGFLIAGVTKALWAGWIVVIALYTGFILFTYFYQKRKGLLLPKLDKGVIQQDETPE